MDLRQQINSILTDIQRGGGDVKAIFPVVASLVNAAIMRNFNQRGRWDGSGTGFFSGGSKKWKPLAKSTQKNYKRMGWELNPTLERTKSLKASIEVNPTSTGIVASANTPYAALHQFGGEVIIPAYERTVKYKAIKTANSYKYRFAKNKSKRAIERKVKYPERRIIIPARPYFTLTDDDLNLISNKIAEYLVNK